MAMTRAIFILTMSFALIAMCVAAYKGGDAADSTGPKGTGYVKGGGSGGAIVHASITTAMLALLGGAFIHV